MCIGHSQHESLVVIGLTVILAGLILPALSYPAHHLGWPTWIVIPATIFVSVAGAFGIILAFLAVNALTDRFDAWRTNRRR